MYLGCRWETLYRSIHLIPLYSNKIGVDLALEKKMLCVMALYHSAYSKLKNLSCIWEQPSCEINPLWVHVCHQCVVGVPCPQHMHSMSSLYVYADTNHEEDEMMKKKSH